MLEIFRLVHGILPLRKYGRGRRKVWARPKSQHSRFKSAIERLPPGFKSGLGGVFGLLLAALRHVLGECLGACHEGIAEGSGSGQKQRQRENGDPCEGRADGRPRLMRQKPSSEFERDKNRARCHEGKTKRVALGETSNIDGKNGGPDRSNPRRSTGCHVGEMEA